MILRKGRRDGQMSPKGPKGERPGERSGNDSEGRDNERNKDYREWEGLRG